MGIKKTSPSHLSISKFQPQQSFYTKNYLKHNKPSQIKQNKQQTNISPQNIVDFGGSPGWIWVFSFSHQISPHFGVTHLGLAAAMTTSGSSATSAFKRSFSPLIPGKVMGERLWGKVRKKMSFRETTKGGCTEKNPKFTRDTEKCWFGTGIETASNMATLGIYVKFPGGNLCSNQNMLRKNLINGW